jgi:hypothetical protein
LGKTAGFTIVPLAVSEIPEGGEAARDWQTAVDVLVFGVEHEGVSIGDPLVGAVVCWGHQVDLAEERSLAQRALSPRHAS